MCLSDNNIQKTIIHGAKGGQEEIIFNRNDRKMMTLDCSVQVVT